MGDSISILRGHIVAVLVAKETISFFPRQLVTHPNSNRTIESTSRDGNR